MKKLGPLLLLTSSVTTLLVLAACSGDDTPAAPVDAGKPDVATVPDTSAPKPEPDTGAPAPTVLTSGDGFSIVYSGPSPIGVDGRADVTATFEAAGGMTGFYASADENLSRGVAKITNTGSDTLAGWGSWREGPTSGKWYDARPKGDFTFGPGNDFHFAIGKKSESIKWPDATKSYALAGNSLPTVEGVEEAGTLTSATATCELGARTCSTIKIDAAAAGGTLAIAVTNGTINVGPAGAGRVQDGGVIAMFAGPAAEEMILIFVGKLTGGTQADKNVRGAAVLKAQ